MSRPELHWLRQKLQIAGVPHTQTWVAGNTYFPETAFVKNSAAPIVIIDASIAAGFRRYGHVWGNHFKDALTLGISGDRVENIS